MVQRGYSQLDATTTIFGCCCCCLQPTTPTKPRRLYWQNVLAHIYSKDHNWKKCLFNRLLNIIWQTEERLFIVVLKQMWDSTFCQIPAVAVSSRRGGHFSGLADWPFLWPNRCHKVTICNIWPPQFIVTLIHSILNVTAKLFMDVKYLWRWPQVFVISWTTFESQWQNVDTPPRGACDTPAARRLSP